MALYDDDPELADLHRRWLAAETQILEARTAERLLARKGNSDGLVPHEVMLELAARSLETLDVTDAWRRLDAEYTAARDRYHDTQSRRD